VKDSEKLLEAFCDYIVVRGSDVDPSLLSKMEVFIKKKECVTGLCALERGDDVFTSSYANGCQAPYFKLENVEQGSQRAIG